jgi:hypothetical protein
MLMKEFYLERMVMDVDDLAARVVILKNRFAQQKVSVKLEHYWELEDVRARFSEFKRRAQDLEDAEGVELARLQEGVDIAWNDLIRAVETLLAALS